MRAHSLRWWWIPTAGVAVAWAAFAQPALVPPQRSAAPSAPAPAAPPAAIATVGERRIARAEFDERTRQSFADYRSRTGTEVPAEMVPVARRQILENLIRRELLVLEARRRGLSGTAAEAEVVLKRDPFFNPGGRFDQARYDAVRASDPAAIQQAIGVIREQMGAAMLNERLQGELGVDEDAIRARTERSLRRAELAGLALRRPDFSGLYPEPRERQVLETYRREAESFRRPERARISVIFVNEPPLADSLAADGAAQRAWEEDMKRRAEGLLARLRGGAVAESVAAEFGGLRGDVVLTRDNVPGFWVGTPSQNDALFKLRSGEWLGEPVRGRPGWLLARVEEVRPSSVAPLSEVAREIRGRLRADARRNAEDIELRAIYDELADSLRVPGARLRYAAVDTSSIAVPEPTGKDLEEYYRSRAYALAVLDTATATRRIPPLAEIEGQVRGRWIADRRMAGARAITDGIAKAWRAGKRDKKLEKKATVLRDVGPFGLGSAADTGLAAAAVSDSVARATAPGVGAGRYARGTVAWQLYDLSGDVAVPFEQARLRLSRTRDARRAVEEERGARALYDAAPGRFVGGNVVRFTEVVVPSPDLKSVPITRQEMERYHQRHLLRYSSPEEMRARHILIRRSGPGAAEDSAARVRADSVMTLARGGEDFEALARRYSEDAPTRDLGGDLGYFSRGAMLPAVERAAFALAPGAISDPVRTDVGYHVIQAVDRRPGHAHPLAIIWTAVGSDLAREKADSVASRRADSLLKRVKTHAQLVTAAGKLGLPSRTLEHQIGDPRGIPESAVLLRAVETTPPGQVVPQAVPMRAQGYALAAVESVVPASPLTWEQARPKAVDAYRRGAGERALLAKRAELDSMETQGWSLDSLAALWGGLQRHSQTAGGPGLPGLGGGSILDSLVLGRDDRPPVLAVGATSPWVEYPGGFARVRLEAVVEPDPGQLAARMENDRLVELDRKYSDYFVRLKERYPVRILDSTLRNVPLAEGVGERR